MSSSRGLLDPEIKPISPMSPALACRLFFTTSATCEAIYIYIYVYILEKAMAPHSSTLACEIPWMEEPGRLQSMGSLRVGHD